MFYSPFFYERMLSNKMICKGPSDKNIKFQSNRSDNKLLNSIVLSSIYQEGATTIDDCAKDGG